MNSTADIISDISNDLDIELRRIISKNIWEKVKVNGVYQIPDNVWPEVRWCTDHETREKVKAELS